MQGQNPSYYNLLFLMASLFVRGKVINFAVPWNGRSVPPGTMNTRNDLLEFKHLRNSGAIARFAGYNKLLSGAEGMARDRFWMSRKAPMQSVGKYDLLSKIAEGGMGAIYRGRHRETGDIVAIKIMPPHMATNPVLLKRFEQEFRAASRLDHPNIVRAIDYGETATSPYLVMEFVEGESLGKKLDRDGPMPEADAIRIIAQVAQGLHRAHKQKLIHRDVKPDNVLLRKDGVAKLADLGLVKEREADLNLTKTGRGLGTPHFMAPEQFRNAKDADVRCDVYSLGATLYQMLTGELPYKSSGPLDAWMKKVQNDLIPPRDLVSTITERANWAIQRAMNADADQRPQSCREFIEDLTGHSTRKVPTVGSPVIADIYYLVYRDENGDTHTVKGSAAAIRRSLKDGMLGDASNIRASRSKQGPFEPLRDFPEFRDLLMTSGRHTTSTSSSSSRSDTPSSRNSTKDSAAAPRTPREPVPRLNLPNGSKDDSTSWIYYLLLFVATAGVAAAAYFALWLKKWPF